MGVGVLGIRRGYFTPGGLAASAAVRNIRPGRRDGFWESYKSEIAAYRLDRLLELDMVPPTVERRYNRESVSVQLWADPPFFDRIQALDRDTLRREIGEFVEGTAIGALLLRRDDIVGAFERLAEEKGADQVFQP
ncbi:MAG: hypothetical protein HY701_11580 [Gemmatimonadetes bacterium]|nr:hypothetical protein [Gemmatimonadota bacterium]